jgi:predicted ABC-type ATPase
MEDGSRRILIVAGPNGAGKTTFACEYLPQEAGCPIFINADLIAEGLSPFAPELVAIRSGRLMLQMIRDHATMFRMTSSVDDILRAVKTSRRSTSPSWMNGSFTTTRGHSRSCSTGEGSDE